MGFWPFAYKKQELTGVSPRHRGESLTQGIQTNSQRTTEETFEPVVLPSYPYHHLLKVVVKDNF